MQTTNNFINRIRELIAKDELPTALKQLQALLKNSPKLDEAILQSARFYDIRKQIRLGEVNYETAELTKNQIRKGLLDLLSEIEQKVNEPVFKEEVSKATATIIQNAEKIYNIEKIDKANFS